jgi:hypothetical protein
MALTKPKARSKRTASVPIPDEELIARLEEKAPEVLSATLDEHTSGAAVEGLLKEPPIGKLSAFLLPEVWRVPLENTSALLMKMNLEG